MLEVNGVRFAYPNGTQVGADFRLAPGHVAALMGASGAGKTTLLNLIAGFLTPAAGSIRFAGKNLLPLPPAARPLTYLFQAHNLFPHLTAWQNIAIGLHPGMRLTAAQKETVDRALQWVALHDYAARKPPTLSGGQQQRVALARCLARERPLLLLDEPFTGLDDDLRAEMLTRIQTLQNDRGVTVLFATHRRADADALEAKILHLSFDNRIGNG